MSPNTHFTPLILAGIALLCGLSVANVYFNQALLPVFAEALHADAGQTSWIATASQMGYALGMLLIVPLGDRVAPLRLCRVLLVWTSILLLLASQATQLSFLAGVSFLLCMGTCIPQVLLPLPGRASHCRRTQYMRSINPTYPKVGQRFTVASLVSSSTAARLRSLRPTRHVATAPVHGAATYRAPGR